MKSMFNTADNREIIERLNKLTPQTAPLWGKMTVAQMLAHCQQPLRVAVGEVKGTQSFIGRLFGGIAKKQLLADKPMKRNLPTDKTFLIKDDRDFNLEKEKLVQLVQKFGEAGPSVLTKDPHPFFGKLSAEEWDKLTWTHLHHHLQQFGV
jgi:hypothetical protein